MPMGTRMPKIAINKTKQAGKVFKSGLYEFLYSRNFVNEHVLSITCEKQVHVQTHKKTSNIYTL